MYYKIIVWLKLWFSLYRVPHEKATVIICSTVTEHEENSIFKYFNPCRGGIKCLITGG
jgi:hypothetical protein